MTSTDDAPVRIVPYDPIWPLLFETERGALADLLAPWLAGPIEHVGSTAVPGLAAKPVIDTMVGVRELEASRPAIADLSRLGYCYAPYRVEIMHWFCKPSPAVRTHHLQLVPWKSQLWLDRLAFRDFLRAHADVATDYAALKRRLAADLEIDVILHETAAGRLDPRFGVQSVSRFGWPSQESPRRYSLPRTAVRS
jgi:GrpB-like predicted nucleotidyltransferase (UPF0157 family)